MISHTKNFRKKVPYRFPHENGVNCEHFEPFGLEGDGIDPLGAALSKYPQLCVQLPPRGGTLAMSSGQPTGKLARPVLDAEPQKSSK